MEVGSVGRAAWTPDQDYTLESVVFGGQAANSLAFLSQNPTLDSGVIGPAEVSVAEFLLMFFGFQMIQVSALDYQAREGQTFYFYVAQGGAQLSLILGPAE